MEQSQEAAAYLALLSIFAIPGRRYQALLNRPPSKDPGLGIRTASERGARYDARELAKHQDYVIIDTPPKIGVDGRPSIEVADLVFIPITASRLDIWATEPTVKMARGENKPTLLVMIRVSKKARVTAEISDIVRKMKTACAKAMLGNRVHFVETASMGLGVLEKNTSSIAAQEILAFSKEVKNHLHSVD